MLLSDLSIRRPVFITMIMLAFVVLGLFALRRLSVDEFPNVDLPVVTVTTTWPGAGPESVETDITKEVEPWQFLAPGRGCRPPRRPGRSRGPTPRPTCPR